MIKLYIFIQALHHSNVRVSCLIKGPGAHDMICFDQSGLQHKPCEVYLSVTIYSHWKYNINHLYFYSDFNWMNNKEYNLRLGHLDGNI